MSTSWVAIKGHGIVELQTPLEVVKDFVMKRLSPQNTEMLSSLPAHQDRKIDPGPKLFSREISQYLLRLRCKRIMNKILEKYTQPADI